MIEFVISMWNSFVNYFFEDGFSIWHLVALLGTISFGSRFIVQWLVSEWRKESIIPVSFWYLSIIGSLLLLTYALFRLQDFFITIGYLPNSIIYFRNLYLIHKKKKEEEEKSEESKAPAEKTE